MSTCPANVWNHTSGCTCAPGGTLTAEAPEIDLATPANDSTALEESTCEWCLGTGTKQDPWNPEITHPCSCQTVRAPASLYGGAGWSNSEPDYEQIAEDRVWARGGARVERDEWGGLDIPS
jgi:hypothetical protein